MSQIDRRTFLKAGAVALAGATTTLGAEEKKFPFSLGLVTYNVGAAWDLPTLLKVCKEAGVSPVELRTTHKHGVEPTLTKEQRKEVKKRFADAGVECWGCGSTCDFHWTDKAKVKQQIELCKRFVELAADIGGKGVKVRPNDLPKGVEPAKTLEQIGKSLIPCGEAAKNAGVEIWVEVHGHGTALPPNMKTIMQHCGHKSVGLTWNSNPTDVKDGSVADSFKLLWPWVRSCHINNLHLATNKYPYKELFKLLRENGYKRTTLIEVGTVYKDPKAGLAFMKDYKAKWEKLVAG
jgi:sugar phosphate isomerase/epimerase